MDVSTRKELLTTFEEVVDDDGVRIVAIWGAGDGAFIAGGDLEGLAEFDHMEGLEYATKYTLGLYNYVADLPKPTIAAVDGYALGGGTEIALACDIRLATDDAMFSLPEVTVGVLPAGGPSDSSTPQKRRISGWRTMSIRLMSSTMRCSRWPRAAGGVWIGT